jgi:hypothetical protein
MGWVLISAVWLGVMSIGAVVAQDKVVLKLGEFVKGEITEKIHEVGYSFSGKKGDIVTLEIMPDLAQPDLDPTVELRNSDGQTLAINDDFNYPLALAIAELPYDGDYIAVAGRSGGDNGDSIGVYNMRVSVAQLVGPGSTIDAKVSSDFDAPAQIYVTRPKKSGPLDITMSQTPGENYAGFKVLEWAESGAPTILANLDNTSKLTKATLTVNLKANNFYVIKLEQAAYSFADPVDFPVTLELK